MGFPPFTDRELAVACSKAGISTDVFMAELRPTLESVTPARCERCGASGAVTVESVVFAVKLHAENAGNGLVRVALIAGCVDAGWGAAGRSEQGDQLVACPECATTGEVAEARLWAGELAGIAARLPSDN